MKLNTLKKAFICLILVALCGTLAAQATLTKYDDLMFWRLDGTDDNGNPSTVYVLGTIHIADGRLYPLPDAVSDAADEADRFCSEVSTEGWAAINDILQQEINDSLADGRNILEDLTQDELDVIRSFTGDDIFGYLPYFEPWVSSLYIGTDISGLGLDAQYGYDVFFTNQLNAQGVHIDGLEEVQVQYKVFRVDGWDAQIDRLRYAIRITEENSIDPIAAINMLYNAYLSGDEDFFDVVSKASEAVEIRKCPSYKGFYDYLFGTRNPVWADEINDYIKMGGTTFIYAGAGHFTGNGSVFSIMKDRGYIAE